MIRKNSEPKLTPAAREALNELVNEYRTQILVGAEQSASNDYAGIVKEISVSNIFESLSKNKNSQKNSLVNRFMEIYQILGIAIVFLGTIIILNQVGNSVELRIGIISIMVGLSLIFLTYIYFKSPAIQRLFNKTTIHKNDKETQDLPLEYIKLWRDIEIAIRELVSVVMGESNAKEPISQLIIKLGEGNLLTIDDRTQLKKLIFLRNRIVHGKQYIEMAKIQDSIIVANRILQQIKHLTENAS